MSESTPITFSSGELFKQAWALIKKKWKLFLKPLGVMFLVQLLVSMLTNYNAENMSQLVIFIVQIASMVLNAVMQINLIKIMLGIIRGEYEQFEVMDLFDFNVQILTYWLGTLTVGLIVVVGMVLLIIPGIIWGIKYSFVPYLIVDKKMAVGEAMKASAIMTAGMKWNIFFFFIAGLILNLLGLLMLIVGVIVTGAVTSLAYYLLYERLLAKLPVTVE